MRSIFALAVLVFVLPVPARAQGGSRCAECHFANMSAVPAPEHLGEWQASAHARHGVTCDKCHGGNPLSYVPAEAHRGVLASSRPDSPVNPLNLVATCGPCHARNVTAFAGSVHQRLARDASRRAPTCVTCHGVMSARVPSPAGLEARCAGCHPAGSAQADYPQAMRAAVEAVNALRVRCEVFEGEIEAVPDPERRADLFMKLYDARVALKEGVARVHAFDVPGVRDRLDAAKRRLDAIAPPLRGGR